MKVISTTVLALLVTYSGYLVVSIDAVFSFSLVHVIEAVFTPSLGSVVIRGLSLRSRLVFTDGADRSDTLSIPNFGDGVPRLQNRRSNWFRLRRIFSLYTYRK